MHCLPGGPWNGVSPARAACHFSSPLASSPWEPAFEGNSTCAVPSEDAPIL